MKGGKLPHGFTIIEVLIVLAVSSLLLLAAILLVAGKQDQTEFDQSMQQISSEIQEDVDNILDGYYPSENNVACSVSNPNTNPAYSVTSGSEQHGTNLGCVFLGAALHFSSQTSFNPQQIFDYTMLGLECQVGSDYSNTGESGCFPTLFLYEQDPVVVAPTTQSVPSYAGGASNYPDITTHQYLQGGLSVYSMTDTAGVCSNKNIGTVALLPDVFTSFIRQVELYPVCGSTLAQTTAANPTSDQTDVAKIDNYFNSQESSTSSIDICFASGTTNQSAMLTLGTDSGTGGLTTSIIAYDGDTKCQ